MMLGEIAGRVAGGLILAIIFVTGRLLPVNRRCTEALALRWRFWRSACKQLVVHSRQNRRNCLHHGVCCFLSLHSIGDLETRPASGPILADIVHSALSVYILLALFWAASYALIEINSPGAFSLGAASPGAPAQLTGAYLFADMLHLSIATLTSTGYGDITPVAPFARSLSQLEQLMGVFYIAVGVARIECSNTQRQKHCEEEGHGSQRPLTAFHGSTPLGRKRRRVWSDPAAHSEVPCFYVRGIWGKVSREINNKLARSPIYQIIGDTIRSLKHRLS